ncbi:hypothetical protein ACWCRC_18685 [Streptomyces sp. NPDC001940]|uniref:hypothetical protein n=1 Tax=Streptomyces sp. NBC_00401 TaxID=2975738 RepID=UPI002B1E06A2|nr:hypothetical protein [Streptomyces sp. NBC_00401]
MIARCNDPGHTTGAHLPGDGGLDDLDDRIPSLARLESADRSVLLALGREPSFAPRIEQDQELVSAEINFYRYWLQHCGLGSWALHLSQHPEDTRLVVSSIQKDQFALIEYELELIAEDSPEDFQKAESARALLPAANDLID